MPTPIQRRLAPLAVLAISLLAGFAAAPAHAAFGRDPYSPVTIVPFAFRTGFGSAIADGSGGMLVCWSDPRGGSLDIYVQRLTSSGAVAPGWPAGGLLVCGAAGDQYSSSMVSDGAGGAVLAWTDERVAQRDIYATRVLGTGSVAPGWPTNGLLVSTTLFSPSMPDQTPYLAPDGAGGAFIAWTLNYSGSDVDVYDARVTSAGALAWTGTPFANFGIQYPTKLLADGAGGFFIAIEDNENTSSMHAKVARLNAAGGQVWGPAYVGAGISNQLGVDIALDGSGGVYGVCVDLAFGTYSNITANHFLANGSNDPGWGGYKTIAPQANVSQGALLALSDGSGGLLTVFSDTRYGSPDLFVQRTGPFGLPWSGWPAGGVALAVAAGSQYAGSATADGTGGAVIEFSDNRLGVDYLLYAVRVLGDGTLAPGWSYGGNPLELAGMSQGGASAVSDGAGGALFSWADNRGAPFNSNGYQGVYAQNMDRYGVLGDARPAITRIADVPNDQGGRLSLQWTASFLDANPSRTVAQYTIWRRVPGGAPEAAARRAAAVGGRLAPRTTIEGAQVVYWEYVATEPARMLPGYSAVVTTTSDSMAAGNPRTSLMVFAESAGGSQFWQSAPDSGLLGRQRAAGRAGTVRGHLRRWRRVAALAREHRGRPGELPALPWHVALVRDRAGEPGGGAGRHRVRRRRVGALLLQAHRHRRARQREPEHAVAAIGRARGRRRRAAARAGAGAAGAESRARRDDAPLRAASRGRGAACALRRRGPAGAHAGGWRARGG